MAYISAKGPKIILTIEWILFGLSLIIFVGMLIGAGVFSTSIINALAAETCEACTAENEDQWDVLADYETGQTIFLLTLLSVGFLGLIFLIIHCVLNVILSKGIKEENSKKVQSWMIIHGVLLVLSMLFTISKIVKGGKGAFAYLTPAVGWIYRAVTIYIVYKYNERLKHREEYLPNGTRRYNNIETNMTEMTDIPL